MSTSLVGGCAISPLELSQDELSVIASEKLASLTAGQEAVSGPVDLYEAMKLTSSQTGSVAKIETFVRDRVLVVSLMLDDQTSDDKVEWKVQRADGRPLPDWLDFVGGDVLMGERAADEEQIDLRVTAVLRDGTLIVNEVRIQTSTGEVQPIKLGKAGSIAPSLYWDRLDAGSLLKEAEVRGLAQRLARFG